MSDLDAARRRIVGVYDPELLERTGHVLVERLAAHLARVQSGRERVLNWRDPQQNTDDARAVLARPLADELSQLTDAANGEGQTACSSAVTERIVAHFSDLIALLLSRAQNLHDPRYVGHQVPASIPLAGLFDAAGSVTNQVMAVYEMGPWATAVEEAMVHELGERIGFVSGTFAGLITHGGSLANLTALLTARNVALGDVWERGLAGRHGAPVLVAHGEAHYSVLRAAGVLGLGTENVIRVPVDARQRMDPQALRTILQDLQRARRTVVAVAANACATPIGAFDPLNAIADICREYQVWLHVDAAHGGAACLSPRHRHLVAGLERADSVAWDAHKMLFMPALCAFVFYRDRAHRFEAFRQEAPYLFDPASPGLAEHDSGMKTLECTKRAAAFGLWGLWSLYGPQLFADLVDVTFALGQQFYDLLQAAADFEPLHRPECNIVAFRHVPEPLRDRPLDEIGRFQLELRRRVIESGEFYLVPTKPGGIGALRTTLINPLTTVETLQNLLETLRREGARLWDASSDHRSPETREV